MEGARFNKPVRLLVSGDTHETTGTSLQLKMLGSTTDRPKFGTGLIPGASITGIVPRRGNVQGAVEKAYIESAHGGTWKSGSAATNRPPNLWGVELDGFWPDEECPQDVYEEGLIRLMTTGGLCTLTFTPLQGLTDLVQNLQDSEGRRPASSSSRAAGTMCPTSVSRPGTSSTPPCRRTSATRAPRASPARLRAVYPIEDGPSSSPDFRLPAHWKRGYGLDVG